MFRRASLSLSQAHSSVTKQLRRNYGVTAPLAQQLDPIQQLFLTKTREYAQKSKYVSEQVTSVTTVRTIYIAGLGYGYQLGFVFQTNMATLYHAEHFTLHELRLGSLLPIYLFRTEIRIRVPIRVRLRQCK